MVTLIFCNTLTRKLPRSNWSTSGLHAEDSWFIVCRRYSLRKLLFTLRLADLYDEFDVNPKMVIPRIDFLTLLSWLGYTHGVPKQNNLRLLVINAFGTGRASIPVC